MKPIAGDTHPEVEKVLIDLLRKASPAEKYQQVSGMIKACRSLSLIGLKRRYPEASTEELHRRLAALWLPREWVVRVYGWDPEKEGY